MLDILLSILISYGTVTIVGLNYHLRFTRKRLFACVFAVIAVSILYFTTIDITLEAAAIFCTAIIISCFLILWSINRFKNSKYVLSAVLGCLSIVFASVFLFVLLGLKHTDNEWHPKISFCYQIPGPKGKHIYALYFCPNAKIATSWHVLKLNAGENPEGYNNKSIYTKTLNGHQITVPEDHRQVIFYINEGKQLSDSVNIYNACDRYIILVDKGMFCCAYDTVSNTTIIDDKNHKIFLSSKELTEIKDIFSYLIKPGLDERKTKEIIQAGWISRDHDFILKLIDAECKFSEVEYRDLINKRFKKNLSVKGQE